MLHVCNVAGLWKYTQEDVPTKLLNTEHLFLLLAHAHCDNEDKSKAWQECYA